MTVKKKMNKTSNKEMWKKEKKMEEYELE